MVSKIKLFYKLTKPGIVYGNDLPALAGFFLGSGGHFSFFLFLSMLLGLSLVIASGCTFNNFIDRDIDQKMARTKNRSLAKNEIQGQNALFFGTVLGLLGFLILLIFTNILTAFVALVGFFFYVVAYSLWGKRNSVNGTLIGSVSGAVPPIVGYCAVSSKIDLTAILLFLILVFWQMPHFYSIAIYRLKDYKAAKIPVLPVVKSLFFTKVNIFLYTLGFTFCVLALSVLGFTGVFYIVVLTFTSLVWLIYSAYGFVAVDVNKWAREMFFMSLLIISIFCISIPIDSILKGL